MVRRRRLCFLDHKAYVSYIVETLMCLRSAGFMTAAILWCAAPGAGQTIQSVLNSASYTNSLAPGTWVAIFGTGLAPAAVSAPSVPFPTQLGNVSVTVAGIAAPLSYVSATQINALIPFEAATLTGTQTATVPVVVTTPSGASSPFSITLTRNAPAIYTKDLSGSGAALAFDANFNPITTVGTAAIVLYATGLGPTNPPAFTNSLGAGTEPLNRVVDNVTVSIGGSSATVLYAGLAPGLHGIYQLNIMPPAQISIGNALTVQVGTYSASPLTLPVPAGTNVTNLTGTIDGIFPATGMFVAEEGGVTGGSPVTFSALLTAGSFTASFDILPGANPFQLVALATSAAGTAQAVLNFNPAQSSFEGPFAVPLVVARDGDFAYASFNVLDFLTCQGTNCLAFPGNQVPISRFNSGLGTRSSFCLFQTLRRTTASTRPTPRRAPFPQRVILLCRRTCRPSADSTICSPPSKARARPRFSCTWITCWWQRTRLSSRSSSLVDGGVRGEGEYGRVSPL